MRTRLSVCLLAFAACQSAPTSAPGGDDVGVIQLAIAAGPADAACLRVTVTGGATAPIARSFDLMPGAATTRTLSGLPVGQVAVSAEAFSAACSAVSSSSVPNWVSDPVPATLTAGTPVAVQLVMRQAGQITISVDWNTSGAGGAGGRGGAGGSAGGGGSGMGGLLDVARALDGQMFMAPCLRDTQAAVCATVSGTCPMVNNADLPLRGVLMTDKTITLGGTPGTSYTITLHVQGEVEAKQYVATMDLDSVLLSPQANGFSVGGSPTQANAYGVYMLRVTNPGATTSTDYFLNSLTPPGVSNHTTYGVDYTATIQAQGGATVRLVASDGNCSQIKNCGPMENDGNTCIAPIVLPNVEPTSVALNPSFNFSVPFNGQWLVMTLKGVSSP
ncbi:MAG TPA: hypothetical protein VIF57_11395 [Polyangia bacterium]|jgi:hypothetical protein